MTSSLKNVPLATIEHAKAFGKEVDQRIERELVMQTTRFWDSHPADWERIRHAEDMHSPGLVHNDTPASTLFADFEKLCEKVTLADYYAWGIHGATEFLVDNDQFGQQTSPSSSQGIATGTTVQLTDDGKVEWRK